ncbi:MAG: ATP-binding protein, partial [Xanthomonadales bacterium]|nr:ATP-binding protein [Xanthomonadales bacterium]
LAASEVDELGQFDVEGDLGDPRLSQPGSGLYAHVHHGATHWNSPSALGLRLPELDELAAGETEFGEPTPELPYFAFRYGIAWQLADESVLPMTVTILVDPSALEQQVEAFRQGLWRSLTAAGVILVMAQIIMMALAFRPLRRVAEDVGRIESGRSARLEGDYPSEIEPLARNVNRLLATEKANQERYRNALDSLAHSLKTPLAVIRAGARVEGEEARDAIDKAAEDMDHLISTRLQRAAASTRRTLAEPVRVAPQAERVLTSLRKVYSHKLISPDVSIDPAVQFFGEQRDLLEIMGNLFDNAFKYGNRAVRIAAGPVGEDAARPGLWLSVEDDGPGIDPARWNQLLKRGVRGDERVEGHGLGLAIVLELVSAYGGEIRIAKSELGGAHLEVEIAPS